MNAILISSQKILTKFFRSNFIQRSNLIQRPLHSLFALLIVLFVVIVNVQEPTSNAKIDGDVFGLFTWLIILINIAFLLSKKK